MSKNYYFISDLHIGGDGPLNECEIEEELIGFLKKLEKEKNAELIIVGDTFGFWELTTLKGIEKLNYILNTHKKLFNQFKKTGSKIKIIIIPGNHDHELVCDAKFGKILSKYNIILEPKQYIIKKIGNNKIWIEHGNQYDEYTAFKPFGNKYFKPPGYYATTKVLANLRKSSDIAKHPWLRYIESVSPDEMLPHWVFSNYFYREMSPLLRYLALPFLLLFTISFFVLITLVLQEIGVFGINFSISQQISKFGLFGKFIWAIIVVDIFLIFILFLIAIPLFLLFKDIKKTLKRYGIIGNGALKRFKETQFENAAKKIFRQNKDVLIYIYGHTHIPNIKFLNKKVVINTGTWLKRLRRIPNRFRELPDVYYPSFQLNYFKIFKEKKKIVIEYHKIPKKFKLALTPLQRFLILMRKKIKDPDIPKVTYIDV